MGLIKSIFCKHYYFVIEDKHSNTGKRMLNSMGYYTMKSKCKFCGKVVEHD